MEEKNLDGEKGKGLGGHDKEGGRVLKNFCVGYRKEEGRAFILMCSLEKKIPFFSKKIICSLSKCAH